MLNIAIGRNCAPTAAVLEELLRERGIDIGSDGSATVHWGVGGHTEHRALNANVGQTDKLGELAKLSEAGIRVPPFSQAMSDLNFPIFGRKRHHRAGSDIVPIVSDDAWAASVRESGVSDFYTEYVPYQDEFRVWVFRDKRLAVYKKELTYPEKLKRLGGTYKNGFAFNFHRDPDREMTKLARKAVTAMEYDFGAVDILRGQDGEYYVLEINSAPGQERARTGIKKLADKIAAWYEDDCPEREE